MVTLDEAGRGIDALILHPPPPPLSPVIEHSWVEDRRRHPIPSAQSWRIVPDGSGHLIFTVHTACDDRDARLRVAVVGPRTVYTTTDKSRRLLTVGVRFRPGVLSDLFRVDAFELTDRSVPLDDLLGPRGAALTRAITDAPDPDTVRTRMDDAVASLCRNGLPRPDVDPALRLTNAGHGRVTTGEVAERLGISVRTLRARFQCRVGISPKRYARVCRLYRVLHHALAASPGHWSRAAVTAGFTDQSHLIHEFHSLLGETPRQFLSRANRS